MEDDKSKCELLFDLDLGEVATLSAKLKSFGYSLERIEVLPNWAKKFLLKHTRSKGTGASQDRYGRTSSYLKRESTGNQSSQGMQDRRGHPASRAGTSKKYDEGGFMRQRGRGEASRSDFAETETGYRNQEGRRRAPSGGSRARDSNWGSARRPREGYADGPWDSPRNGERPHRGRFSETF